MQFKSEQAPLIVRGNGQEGTLKLQASADGVTLVLEHEGRRVAVTLDPLEAESQGLALIKAAAVAHLAIRQNGSRSQKILNGTG